MPTAGLAAMAGVGKTCSTGVACFRSFVQSTRVVTNTSAPARLNPEIQCLQGDLTEESGTRESPSDRSVSERVSVFIERGSWSFVVPRPRRGAGVGGQVQGRSHRINRHFRHHPWPRRTFCQDRSFGTERQPLRIIHEGRTHSPAMARGTSENRGRPDLMGVSLETLFSRFMWTEPGAFSRD